MPKLAALVSVVVPVHNASAYLQAFVQELSAVLAGHFQDYEIILVDNASSDDSVALVESLQKALQNLLLLRLARRVDNEVALSAGLDNCIGDFVITLDPACDPPELIPQMVQLARQGKEIIYAVAETQRRGALPGWLQHKFYDAFQGITHSTVPDNFSTYRLLTRRLLNFVLQNEDRHRLFKVIPALAGFPHAELAYRPAGTRPATPLPLALFKGLDIIFSISIKPLRLVTFTALVMAALNLLYTVYVLFIALFKENVAEGWITLSLQTSGMFFLLSLILAILAEYIFRMMESMQRRPLYQIAEESYSKVLTHQRRLNVVSSEPEAKA
jgi:glycosyltransferase involved in cell wall biosynthesis